MAERAYQVDLLKGLAALAVLLLHALPVRWLMPSGSILHIGQSVPVFVLLQSYLFFSGSRTWSWRKVVRRMVVPFAAVQALLVLLLWRDPSWSVKAFVYAGGSGPGAYYLWIYLQSLGALSLLGWALHRWGEERRALVWITVGWVAATVALEALCFGLDVSATKYRLLAVRYLPLYLLGYWLTRPLDTRWVWACTAVGAAASLADVYAGVRIAALPYWAGFHALDFLYVFGLVRLLWAAVRRNRFLEWCGRRSWDIFLVQMAFYAVFPSSLSAAYGRAGEVLFCVGSIAAVVGLTWFLQYVKTKLPYVV